MRSNFLKYKIEGNPFPVLMCDLQPGERLFNTTITGPGKVWLQSMPVSKLAANIIPFVSSGS